MTVEGGEPKDMTGFVRLAEKGMWSAVTQLEVQDFTQRTLAIALMKLMEVFVRSSLALHSFRLDSTLTY